MTREVDLVSYLPQHLKEFKEIQLTLDAENPEFNLLWDAADGTLSNLFIQTADEYGISRYESMLGIVPNDTDTLDIRRARVMAQWFDATSYSLSNILQMLIQLCPDVDFVFSCDFEKNYTLTLITDLEQFTRIAEIEEIFDTWLPANIYYTIEIKNKAQLMLCYGIVSIFISSIDIPSNEDDLDFVTYIVTEDGEYVITDEDGAQLVYYK